MNSKCHADRWSSRKIIKKLFKSWTSNIEYVASPFRAFQKSTRMIFSLIPTCNERTPLNIWGPLLKNHQPIFIKKTVPESVEVEFSRRKLISRVHKGAGYQFVAQEENGVIVTHRPASGMKNHHLRNKHQNI
jgi:hypothetical protein